MKMLSNYHFRDKYDSVEGSWLDNKLHNNFNMTLSTWSSGDNIGHRGIFLCIVHKNSKERGMEAGSVLLKLRIDFVIQQLH